MQDKSASEVFAENLAAVILDRGLTVQSVADCVGVNRTFISQIIHKHNSPTVKTVEKLSKALHVPLTEMFNPNFDAAHWHVEHGA